jgi:hypothetical protein
LGLISKKSPACKSIFKTFYVPGTTITFSSKQASKNANPV